MKTPVTALLSTLALLAACATFVHAADQSAAAPVAQAMQGALVNTGTGTSTTAFEDYEKLAGADFFVFYYSAGWCGPCRNFTPDLIEKYNELKEKHDNFELVFFSSDRTGEAMADYMSDYPMPWPAVAYDRRDDVAPASENRSRAIPGMAILDREGNVLAHSHPPDGDRVGARGILEQLERILGES